MSNSDGFHSDALLPSNQSLFFDKADWLTTSEAAAYLRKFRRKDGTPSVESIYMLIQRGRLRKRKPFGRLLFSRRELERAVSNSK